MKRRLEHLVFLLLSLLVFSCGESESEQALTRGTSISESALILSDTFLLEGADSLDSPVVTIEGDHIVVDFQNALLLGSSNLERPDLFRGTAVRIQNSKSVTIRNLTVRGYKTALRAENVDSLLLENCDFSYNFRQRLKSTRTSMHPDDELTHQQDVEAEWLRYGAAISLENCNDAIIKNLEVTGGQNGILMSNCNQGLLYNNTIQFNSGIGIGLYQSNNNRVMHNRLDWNVRGYSHGFYSHGQGSAGVICLGQSSQNTIAFNSATHSGNGLLFSEERGPEMGEERNEHHLIYRNDLSHAPASGVASTFSQLIIAGNQLEECRNGIWGAYSHHTQILANEISHCSSGVAIENGYKNVIANNYFTECEKGVWLRKIAGKPEEGKYSKAKEKYSIDYNLQQNAFLGVAIPLFISGTQQVAVNDRNYFVDFNQLLIEEAANEALVIAKNEVYGLRNWADASGYKMLNRLHASERPGEDFLKAQTLEMAPLPAILPPPLEDGMDVALDAGQLRGRKYILMDEWGPYDFKRPAVWLRNRSGNRHTFLLLGPKGNWKVVGGAGIQKIVPKTGSFPATISVQALTDTTEVELQFEFIGERTRTQFGELLPRGSVVKFAYP
jgi:parallel beta-helix repeat protein